MSEPVCKVCGCAWRDAPGTMYCVSQHGLCGICNRPRCWCKCLGSVASTSDEVSRAQENRDAYVKLADQRLVLMHEFRLRAEAAEAARDAHGERIKSLDRANEQLLARAQRAEKGEAALARELDAMKCVELESPKDDSAYGYAKEGLYEPNGLSDVAKQRAHWLLVQGQALFIARALQALMNERDRFATELQRVLELWEPAQRRYQTAGECALMYQQRAEAAEARCVLLESDSSNTALAWRRVSELQARGTELVLERRAVEAKLVEFVRAVHAYASLLKEGWSLHAIAERYKAKP